MDSAALVIGGGVAGLQAALDLAEAGVQVHLIDSSPFLGSQDETDVPGHILKARFLELAKHPNVRVWDSTKVEKIVAQESSGDLQHCRFHVELSQKPRYVDLSRCTACGECIGVCPVIVPGAGRQGSGRYDPGGHPDATRPSTRQGSTGGSPGQGCAASPAACPIRSGPARGNVPHPHRGT